MFLNRLALSLALLSLPVAQSFAQTGAIPRAKDASDALIGLKSVQVGILLSGSYSDTATIRTKAELKLRQNGIMVSTDADSYFLVQCLTLTGLNGLFPLSCHLSLLQNVTRISSPMVMTAKTWEGTEIIRLRATNNARNEVSELVDELLDDFLNGYLKANPKKN